MNGRSLHVQMHNATVSPIGQFIGAIIMFGVLGFLPAFIVAKILSSMDLLRIPRAVEIAGLDVRYDAQREEAVRDVNKAMLEEAQSKGIV